ncbi:MAG: PilC/PilY family type IV pilus protein [Woeseia sp.]
MNTKAMCLFRPAATAHILRSAVSVFALAVLPFVLAGAPARAEISQEPLVLTAPVNPNLILGIDDSGSMDGELLMPANDGALWWHTGNQSFADGSSVNFNPDGSANDTWKKYVYLFPNGTGLTDGRRNYADSTHDHYAVPPVPAFAFARSPEFNSAYFNPGETYSPWPDVGGYTFNGAVPASAKTDPVYGSVTLDLTADSTGSDQNHVFRMFAGMTLPSGSYVCIKNGPGAACSWTTLAADELLLGDRWVGIRYFPATFYVSSGAALPAAYESYTGDLTPSGHSPGAALPDLVRYEIKPGNFSNSADYDTAIQNFANWFTYYRKRHLATRGGIARSFDESSRLYAGSFRINSRSNVSMRDLSVESERQSFFQEVLTSVGSGGTPNREALYHAGQQYERTDSSAPITYSCQQNFTALFTDGFSNPTSGLVDNEDGTAGSPFEDTASGTMADIAMHFYQKNLRPDLPAGDVISQQGCASANPDPWLDCREDLHMVTFGIVLGNKGEIYLEDEAATEDPYSNPPAWPLTFPNRHPSAVDDLWHATINSRGDMLSARRPSEISDKFGSVLNNIAGRVASAAAVATNSTRLGSDTAVFQAAFDSSNWSGELQAFRINDDGSVNNSSVWAAGDELDAISEANLWSRNILTAAPPAPAGGSSLLSTTGRDFVWHELATSQQEALRQQAGGGSLVSEAEGQARLDYLRGSRVNEQPGGGMRKRDSRLGDIVNSDPQFIYQQDFGYLLLDQSAAFSGMGVGASYKAYRESAAYQSRPPMVVVGANDGMLHGFDASLGAAGGKELFSFVPHSVYDNLYELTLPEYSHRFYVDGSARVADALLNGTWRSIAVGVAGAGGKSVFALDVTTPGTMTDSDVLWEFSHPSMGYTMGQPAVVPLPNKKFGVVVTSGYESGATDGVIWILDPADGSIIFSIALPNSGGLGAPLVVDLDSDRVADRIYVGDTEGNVWRVDLVSGNTSSWKPPKGLMSGTKPVPLFVARDAAGQRQAITSPLSSAFNDKGRHALFFGTGSFYRVGDNLVPASPDVDSFYGLIDEGQVISGRADLLEQEILAEVSTGGTRVRGVTDHDLPDGGSGWFIDLLWKGTYGGPGPAGERVVSRAAIRGDRVIFATVIPNPDPCAFGGESWLMELNTFDGGRLDYAVFDLNNDGNFDENDWITVTDENGNQVRVPPSGIAPDINIIKTPAIIAGIGENQDEVKVMSGSSGQLIRISERGGVGIGRQSWRQLR